jgi:hypothetical protein
LQNPKRSTGIRWREWVFGGIAGAFGKGISKPLTRDEALDGRAKPV